jgi:hypothetical protein
VFIILLLPIYPLSKKVFVLTTVSAGYELPKYLEIGETNSLGAPENVTIVPANQYQGHAYSTETYVGGIYIMIENSTLYTPVPTMNIVTYLQCKEYAISIMKSVDGTWALGPIQWQ